MKCKVYYFFLLLIFLFGNASEALLAAGEAPPLKVSARVYLAAPALAVVRVTVSSGWHINSDAPRESFLIPAHLVTDEPSTVFYPPALDLPAGKNEKPLAVFEGTFDLVVLFSQEFRGPSFRARFAYQGCGEGTCAVPDELSIEVASPARIRPARLEGGWTRDLESWLQSPPPPPPVEKSLEARLQASSLPLALLLLFLLGLGLNLTPCVYPMIPITVGFFVRQASDDFKRQVLLAFAYFLGICVTYSLLGLVAARTGGLFGSLLQNPLVILVVAVIFVVLALSLLGLYELEPPPSLMNLAGETRTGVFGSFFMGTTVGIVAAPCVGPVLLGLLTYVGKLQDALLGFLYFFSLSAGLGLPYLVLGIFSGSLKALPRSGQWMVGIRKIFGFILLALAYHTIAPLFGGGSIPYRIGWLPLGLMACLYLLRDAWMQPGWLYRSAASLAGPGILLFSIVAALPSGRGLFTVEYGLPLSRGYFRIFEGAPEKSMGPRFEPYTPSTFEAARAAGRPALVDFRADWCAACRELEELTFPDESLRGELSRFALFKVDLTSASVPADQAALRDQYQIRGLPTILFFTASGQERGDLRLVGFAPPPVFLGLLKAVHTVVPGK